MKKNQETLPNLAFLVRLLPSHSSLDCGGVVAIFVVGTVEVRDELSDRDQRFLIRLINDRDLLNGFFFSNFCKVNTFRCRKLRFSN
jgi:hypothetical protein